ncbi:hypothetical protein CG399_01030 [Bifidobacteriaceae bacterium NR015]|nr:hypothetical protein CG399_01030 [Bifidobacteriaceae bacterium NR015]
MAWCLFCFWHACSWRSRSALTELEIIGISNSFKALFGSIVKHGVLNARAGNALATELALKAHCAFNLSKLSESK